MPQNYPFDLLANGVVRIDVKAASMCANKYFSYALHKAAPCCDLYILVEIRENEPSKFYVVPSKNLRQKQVCMGLYKTVYEKYQNRFDYIDRYTNLFGEIE